jgi:nucleotide-binding universal stress UspA family protein
MTTKPVVAGTDRSAESIQAVEWAAREAELHGAPLRIVSAAEVLPRMTPPPHVVDLETVARSIYKNRDWALSKAAQFEEATLRRHRTHGPAGVTCRCACQR